MTSPDYQIVEFTYRGISFVYEGSSRSVIVAEGEDDLSIKERIDDYLQDVITQHVPAANQIRNALLSMGVPRSEIPKIKLAEEQPTDTIPSGAIS